MNEQRIAKKTMPNRRDFLKNAAGAAAKMVLVGADSGVNLRLKGGGLLHQGDKTVGRRAGDNLHMTRFLKAAKTIEEVAMMAGKNEIPGR